MHLRPASREKSRRRVFGSPLPGECKGEPHAGERPDRTPGRSAAEQDCEAPAARTVRALETAFERIGAAHDPVGAGFDVAAIANAGGWKSLMMPNYYTRDLRAKQSAMAQMIGRRVVSRGRKSEGR